MRRVNLDEVTDRTIKFADELNLGNSFKCERLIANLNNKKKSIESYILLRVNASSLKLTFIPENVKNQRLNLKFSYTRICPTLFLEKQSNAQMYTNVNFFLDFRKKALEYNRKLTVQSVRIIHKDLVIVTLKRLLK